MAAGGEDDPRDTDLRENRFAYLLQPIRDLATNWDIDIAAELEEYLEELEGITFSIEDCGPSLNFAEAALLIQGTTCVYSKKVEYLHNLVFRALETIHNKKQRERAAADDEGGGGKRGQRQVVDGDLDAPEAFLALDEVALGQVAGEGDIDLDEGGQDDDDMGPPELLRPPTALLALEDAAAAQGEPDAGCFQLAQCAVHESGALLLELRDGEMYDRQLKSRTANHNLAWGMAPPARTAPNGSSYAAAAPPSGAFGGFGEASMCDDCNDGGGYWDGGSDGGDDVDGIDMDDGLPGPGGRPAADGAPSDDILAGDAQPAGADAALMEDQQVGIAANRQTRGTADNSGESSGYRAGAEPFDPYRPLDPNDKGTLLIKPLVVRKPKRRTVRATCPAAGAMVPVTASGQLANAQEFGYLAAALGQVRKTLAAKAARQWRGPLPGRTTGVVTAAGLLLQRPQGRAVLDWSDVVEAEREEADALMPAVNPAGGGGSAGDDDWGADDGDGLYGGGYDADLEGGHDPAMAGEEGRSHALQAALEEAAGAGGGLATGWLHGTDGSDEALDGDQSRLTYEELCRAHIEKLIAAAAAQQVQSDLQVRVATWRQRIDPVLSAEEDRSAFDIHDYGGTILNRLGGEECSMDEANKEGGVPFGKVVACSNRFDVARMFAAMLQLVNNRNVELCKSDLQNPSQPFSLQLLSTDRHHEMMGERIEATAPGGNTTSQPAAEPGPSQQQPEVPERKVGKDSGGRRRGGKATAASKKKAVGGSSSDGDSGWNASDSDEENRVARQRRNTKGAAAGDQGKKPAAKRPRQTTRVPAAT